MANDNCKLCNTFHPYTKHATITAGELSGRQLGIRVRVTNPVQIGIPSRERHSVIYGTLLNVEHGAALISEKPVCSNEETFVIGRTWALLTFEFGGARVSPEATVELLG